MSNSSNTKGLALEKAVRHIEETIIRNSPALAKAEFEIESRKTLVVDGVGHEIDVWVTIHKGAHFEATHIFEAKNWQVPVTKTEILDFAEKIRVTGAARGYFVARKFTSGALAQAKLCKHMELLEVIDEFASSLDGLQMTSSEHRIEKITLSAQQRGVASVPNPPILDSRSPCQYQGQLTTILNFCVSEVNKLIHVARNKYLNQYSLIGTHQGQGRYRWEFDPGELIVRDTIDVEYMDVNYVYSVETRAAHVISKFEIKGRGRVHTFRAQSVGNPEVAIEMDIVQTLPRQ